MNTGFVSSVSRTFLGVVSSNMRSILLATLYEQQNRLEGKVGLGSSIMGGIEQLLREFEERWENCAV